MAKKVQNQGSDPALLRLLLQALKSMPETVKKEPKELIEAARAAVEGNQFFQAQLDIYQAIAGLESGKGNSNLQRTASSLLKDVNEKSKLPELKEGDTFSYTGPTQIGNCLWICSYDDLPEDLQNKLSEGVGYFIVDPYSIASGKYEGYKGLRDKEKVNIKKLIGSRFDPESVKPNENITISREGEEIKILNPEETLHPQQILRNASYARLLAARGQINSQLYSGELKGQENAAHTKAQLGKVKKELIRRIEEAIGRTYAYRAVAAKGGVKVVVVNGNDIKVETREKKNKDKITLIKVGQELLRPLDYKDEEPRVYRQFKETLKTAIKDNK